MSVNALRRSAPVLLSAVLVALTLPSFDQAYLVFVAIVPWLATLRNPETRAFRSGYLFGLLFWLGQMAWILGFVGKWTGSFALASVPWAVCGFLGAWYFGVLGWTIHRCFRTDRAWAIPFVWAGLEVVRSYVPYLAFPWSLIATPLAAYPAVGQLAHFGTVYLVSAWVVAINLAVLQGWDAFTINRPSDRRTFTTTAGVCLVLLLVSLARFQSSVVGDTMRITAGQPGVDLAYGDSVTEPVRLREAIQELYGQAEEAGSSLLVLPEGLVSGGGGLPPLTPFEVRKSPAVLFGGTRGNGPSYQSAFKFDGAWDYADKTRLVIFGEYVPGRDALPFLRNFNLPSGDLQPGSEVKTLAVVGIKVGPLLCFEGLFHNIAQAHAMNGARLLAIMSIDDWYMGTSAPAQLRTGAVWRAIETGLPVVRSASLGSTLFADARGRILGELPLGKRGAITRDVVLPRNGESAFRPIVGVVPWAFATFFFVAMFFRPRPEI
ncbi:MAG: apolipoprotein N-acyltransferase [Fimbriimonadaceae bacterium]|nr:apolipoprotein N-acyltransferase [Fimbriimonadaceae bacterium]